MSKLPSAAEYLAGFKKCYASIQGRRKLLDAHVGFPVNGSGLHEATMEKLAKKVGYKNFNAGNLQYGLLARTVSEAMGLPEPDEFGWLGNLVKFSRPDPRRGKPHWQLMLRSEVAEAWAVFNKGK